jgi:hypothetical protein
MLPNLVVIGAHKAGTTSLQFYLGLHPQIQMSDPKELDFFLEEHGWKKGVAWYASHFHGPEPVHGEGSPSYTLFPIHTGIAQRMSELLPDARLIYILRDPIERMLSHYNHRVSVGWESRPLDEALLDEGENRYLTTSRYCMQLEEYRRFYPASRILILTSEELATRRATTLRRTFEFLGVDPGFTSPRFATRLNRRSFRRRQTRLSRVLEPHIRRLVRRLPRDMEFAVRGALQYPFTRRGRPIVLNDAVRRELVAGLADDLARLRRLSGRAFGDWSL